MSDKLSGTNQRPTPRRRWWVIAAVAFAIALVIAFLIWQISHSAGSGPDGAANSAINSSATPRATPAPTPSSGGIEIPEVNPTTPMEERPTLPFGDKGELVPGVTGRITAVESVLGTASGPGEVAGPAIRFKVEFKNSTSSSLTLATTVINVEYGPARTPAGELSGPGVELLPLELAVGQTSSGTYVFSVPADQRDVVRITVDYAVDVEPLIFEGTVPA